MVWLTGWEGGVSILYQSQKVVKKTSNSILDYFWHLREPDLLYLKDLFTPWTHLSGKTKTGGNPTHGRRYDMIQIRVRCGAKFKRPKTNIVKRFIIKREHFISGLNQLVNS